MPPQIPHVPGDHSPMAQAVSAEVKPGAVGGAALQEPVVLQPACRGTRTQTPGGGVGEAQSGGSLVAGMRGKINREELLLCDDTPGEGSIRIKKLFSLSRARFSIIH